ncbi:MAG: MBL fold metallo-hydrolase [Bacteroidales bacterium]|nr:MBL fold metallo-hydrolase [Bacteroidales bacterium]
MKYIATGLVGILFSLSGCVAQNNNSTFNSYPADEFENHILDAGMVRLDVRTYDEYISGHITDAINIDVNKSDFEDRALSTLPKTKTIAVYCRSGNRSKKAANILLKNGFKVIELDKGITSWTAAGKQVTTEEVDMFSTLHQMPIFAYCIKHGSVKLRVGDAWIYVDPVANAIPPVTDFTTMPKADIILITHEHMDHLDSLAINQLTKEGTQLILNPRSSEILGNKGVVMKNGDNMNVAGTWGLEAVPAYNNSEDKQQFHPKGRDNGYILTIDGFRIYIAGDTEDIDEMKDIKDIDVAFLPCNLPFTMTPEQLANAANIIKPKVLFPYHYGQTDISQVVKLLEGSSIDVRIRQYQ